jgi:hypothetical protein
MARYRIICTTQEPSTVPNDRAHIVAVGTGASASSSDLYWQLSEVLTAMDRGDTFYTFGETSRKTAEVEKYKCPRCSETHIRSNPDTVQDNNLDNLATCKL